VVSGALLGVQVWLRLIGGGFLCYLGLRTLLAAPAERAANAPASNLPRAYVSALALTLTNPLTILSFAAIFAGLGAATGGGYKTAALLVLGVFAGSASWWVILTTVVTALRARVTPRGLRWVNRVSGAIILGFGILALVSLR